MPGPGCSSESARKWSQSDRLMGRFRLKAHHQNRTNKEDEFAKNAGGDFISDSIASLLSYYGEENRSNNSQVNSHEDSSSFLNPAEAVGNLPKSDLTTVSTPEVSGKASVKNRILGIDEVMGIFPFLNRLKNAENEWYEVFSDYVRQRKAEKDKKRRAAKIFRRTELLVRAAISCETLKREGFVHRSVAPRFDSEPTRDDGLPEGKDLVGRTVALAQSDSEDPSASLSGDDNKRLHGVKGEARVLCAVWSSSGSVCSGYLVEWIRLGGRPWTGNAPRILSECSRTDAELPVAACEKIVDPLDCGMEGPGDDGLDYVPAAQMHGGQFTLA